MSESEISITKDTSKEIALKVIENGEEGGGGSASVDNSVYEALFKACQSGERETVKKILQENPSLHINFSNSHGDTAVHAAACGGNIDIIKLLRSSGAILDATNQHIETALHIAAKFGFLSLAMFLAEQKLDLNKRNEVGETAVHLAARQGHVEVVEFLHLSGADVNIQNNKGCTALHMACQRRNGPIAHVLLHLGCRMDLVDHMEELALHDACREELLSVVQTMCAYGCPVDLENKSGLSPLHMAAKTGNSEIVRCLLLSGADMDKYNKDGLRAEDIAVAQGHTEIADMLNKLTSSIARDRRDPYVKQLLPTARPLGRVIIKVFGSSGVGKSTVIESLKCGYLRSFLRRGASYFIGGGAPAPAEPITGKGVNSSGVAMANVGSLRCDAVPLSSYTRGIDMQRCNLSDAGDVSIWEFSSYEPYYSTYGRFVGNANSIHVIVVSMKDSTEERRRQIYFWLSYIRARVAPTEPIGVGGLQQWAPQVALVVTHADDPAATAAGCTKNDEGEWVLEKELMFMNEIQQRFNSELMIIQQMFLMDARQPMNAEMKYLRVALAEMKQSIVESLPPSLGFLDTMVAELPTWTRLLASYPVVSWSSFSEYVHSKVNMLATEDHLRELVCQLHIIGEVVPLAGFGTEREEKIILNPRWLGNDIIGRLMSYKHVMHAPPSGRLTKEQMHGLFPDIDPNDANNLVAMLDLGVVYQVNGEPLCDFPCLNSIDISVSALWEDDDPGSKPVSQKEGRGDSPAPIMGGLRVVCPQDPDGGCQLVHVFSDVQLSLQRELLFKREGYRICQWCNGCRITINNMAAVIYLAHNGTSIELQFRSTGLSPPQPENIFYLQEDLCEIVYSCVERSCPGLYLERDFISVADLQRHEDLPHAYSPSDVFKAHLKGKSQISRSTGSTDEPAKEEKLVQLLAYGSSEIFSRMTLGPDLHPTYLPLYARCRLAYILDEPNQPGKDWIALSEKLGLTSDDVGRIQGQDGPQRQLSCTDRMLALWVSQKADIKLSTLYQSLLDMGRSEAAEIVARNSPTFFYILPASPTGEGEVEDQGNPASSGVPVPGAAQNNPRVKAGQKVDGGASGHNGGSVSGRSTVTSLVMGSSATSIV